ATIGAGATNQDRAMQRLRSPFRLRPGPGADQRKSKTRREQGATSGTGGMTDARRSDGSEQPQDHAAGDSSSRTIVGEDLRGRRAGEQSHDQDPPKPAKPDPTDGSA
ncbi:MAG: hypothetical protein ABJC33_10440, partial [Betaproteobacteria bacterium]